MATIYGARLWTEPKNEADLHYDSFGKNSEVFAVNDIVGLSAGQLLVATAAIVGVVAKTVTMSSTNVTVAKVQPPYIPIENDQLRNWRTASESISWSFNNDVENCRNCESRSVR